MPQVRLPCKEVLGPINSRRIPCKSRHLTDWPIAPPTCHYDKTPYHSGVFRTFVFAILIVLMPIRGVIGDAMAIGMQSHSSSASSNHQSTNAVAQKLVECQEHGGSMAVEATDVDVNLVATQDSKSCSNCSLCDVCHSVAFTLSGMQDALDVMSSLHPQVGNTAFLSAERAVSLKPPIS